MGGAVNSQLDDVPFVKAWRCALVSICDFNSINVIQKYIFIDCKKVHINENLN